MKDQSDIVAKVYAAKEDKLAADDLIEQYLPFIRAEASRCTGHYCSPHDDETSIAMIAFYEAIQSYEAERGNFLSYASLMIKNRLIDDHRRERRHVQVIRFGDDDDNAPAIEQIPDKSDFAEELMQREQAASEIREFAEKLKDFDLTISDVADQCPQQDRTLRQCQDALEYAKRNPELIRKMVRTKKLPIKELAAGSAVSRKTLERHRRYVVALLLIYSNGFDTMRAHLKEMGKQRCEA